MQTKPLSVLLLAALIISGCSHNRQPSPPSTKESTNTQKITKECPIVSLNPQNCTIHFEADGVGIQPCQGSCSPAQAKVMARRSAIIDAYRNLTEKLYGIRIKGRDTVGNMALKNSQISTYVSGVIKGATIESEEYRDGIYRVVLSLKIDGGSFGKPLLFH